MDGQMDRFGNLQNVEPIPVLWKTGEQPEQKQGLLVSKKSFLSCFSCARRHHQGHLEGRAKKLQASSSASGLPHKRLFEKTTGIQMTPPHSCAPKIVNSNHNSILLLRMYSCLLFPLMATLQTHT